MSEYYKDKHRYDDIINLPEAVKNLVSLESESF